MAKPPRRAQPVKIRRGDVVVGVAKGAYFGRARPCVVIQANVYDHMDSVVVCPITTQVGFGYPMRVRLDVGVIDTSESDVQVDKLIAMPRDRIDKVIARLPAALLGTIDAALLDLLDLRQSVSTP